MKQLRGMLLCSMMPELSVVLRTMRGVRMPCPCLPRPSPTLQPNFCIMRSATCYFYSSWQPSPYSGTISLPYSVSVPLTSSSSYGYSSCRAPKSTAQLCFANQQELGCWGSYSISTAFFCSSRFSRSTQVEMAVVMAIFLADSMLFNFEFRLARVSFFFPPDYSLAVQGFCQALGGGGAGDGSGGGDGCAWEMELMKLFNFFQSYALSLLSWNFGTGGGRFSRSISLFKSVLFIIINDYKSNTELLLIFSIPSYKCICFLKKTLNVHLLSLSKISNLYLISI